jgi:hypothetical protein
MYKRMVAIGLSLLIGFSQAFGSPQELGSLDLEIVGTVLSDTLRQANERQSVCAKERTSCGKEPDYYEGSIAVQGQVLQYLARDRKVYVSSLASDSENLREIDVGFLRPDNQAVTENPLMALIFVVGLGIQQALCSEVESQTADHCRSSCGNCSIAGWNALCVAGYRSVECVCDCTNIPLPRPNPINGFFGWGPNGGAPFLPTTSTLSGPWVVGGEDPPPGTGWLY